MPRNDGRSSRNDRMRRQEPREKKQRYNPFDNEIEKPDPGPPEKPRAPPLRTCPNRWCNANAYCVWENDVGRTIGYCINCATETLTHRGDVVESAPVDPPG